MLVHHFLENSAIQFPDKIALISDGRRLTYDEVNQSSNNLASALVRMGIKRQDRVIIFDGNTVESAISVFGILKAGAIFVLLNPAMKQKKLNYILRDSGARALIVDSRKARVITFRSFISSLLSDAEASQAISNKGLPTLVSSSSTLCLLNMASENAAAGKRLPSSMPLTRYLSVVGTLWILA